MNSYDVIIVGLGAMGTAAAWQCSNRNLKVLGLEQYEQGHTLGSSHGTTRAIRETYFEDSAYVPLVQRSYELWEALQREYGKQLIELAGALYFAPVGSKMLQGVEDSARKHNLPFEVLSAECVAQQYPGFSIEPGWQGFYENRGGIIQSAESMTAQLELAKHNGADIRHQVSVKSWSSENNMVTVQTSQGTFRARHLLLTLGPWACKQLADLKLPITGKKITGVIYEPERPKLYCRDNFSVYFWATPQGVFAGFPNIEGEGVKIMRHDVQNICTPDSIDRTIYQEDIDEVSCFVKNHMPFANSAVNDTFTCMYTVTPDNHFIVDQIQPGSNISYATGFSGHGFKFAPVIGEILADFVETGETQHDIKFLRSSRFS